MTNGGALPGRSPGAPLWDHLPGGGDAAHGYASAYASRVFHATDTGRHLPGTWTGGCANAGREPGDVSANPSAIGGYG